MNWVIDSECKKITQGTILEGVDFGQEENPLCIVLSNACDFENDKLGYVTVAVLVPASDTLLETREVSSIIEDIKEGKPTKKQKDSLRRICEDKICNKTIGRYYYFDPSPVLSAPAFFVDFQNVVSLVLKEFSESVGQGIISPIGQLAHPFVEQMMSHYASYIGRVPSDRPSEGEMRDLINALVPLGIA